MKKELSYRQKMNGNGEGEPSPARTTERGGLADWDPRPDERFRRYTRSHEYGYNGFDHWGNIRKSVIPPARTTE